MAVLRYLLTPFLCTTDAADGTAKSDWPSEDETSDEEYESDDDSSNAMNTTPATATRVGHEADNNTIPATSHERSTGIVPACRADCNISSTQQPAASAEIDTMCTSYPPSYIYRTSHHHHHHTHRRRYVVDHTPPQPQQPSSSSVTRSNKSNKMPFWSRLLCRPEVYDPCVEAAPTAGALRLQRPNTTTTRVSDAAYDTPHAVTYCVKDALRSCTQGVSECVASQDSDAAAAVAEENACDSSKHSKTDTMSMTQPAPIAVVVRQDMSSDAPGQPHDRTTQQQHTSTSEESAVTASAACVSSTTTTSASVTTMCAAAVRPASTLRGFRVQDTRFMQGTWCTPRHHACTTDTTHTATCVAALRDTLCRTDRTSPCHTTHDTQYADCTTDSAVTATNDSSFTTPPVSASLIVTPEQLSSDECEAATWRRHWAALQAERTRLEQLRRVRLERRKAEYAAWRELCTATSPLAALEGCTHGEYKGRQTKAAADDEGQQPSCTSEACTAVLHAECDEDALPLSYSTKTTTTTDEEEGEEAAQSTSRQYSVAAALVRRRLARCCGNAHDVLGCSRRYIENAILTQRSQQVHALLALLSEARRHAWTLSCRLMQLYYYYIHPILQLTANEITTTTHSSSLSWASHKSAQELAATLLTRSSSPAVRAIHQQYLYDTRVTLDYQLFRYVFDRTWNRLMHDVRSYLGPPCRPRTLSRHTTCEALKQKGIGMTRKRSTRDERHTLNSVAEDEACNAADLYSTTRPTRCAANIDGDVMLPLSHETRYIHRNPHGSVRYAATLLYALEMFERQHSLQCAVHEAERWIAWYYAAMTTGSLHTVLHNGNNDNEEGCAVGSGAALSADADECDAAGTVTQLAVDTNKSNTCTSELGDTTTQSATSKEMDSAVACYSNDDEQAECCSMSCTLSTTSTTGLSVSPSLPQTPQLQLHTSHDDVPHIRLLSTTTSSVAQEKADDVTTAASCAHLPMQWHKAQDDALRETVSEERRWRRLCTVIAANRALQAKHGSM